MKITVQDFFKPLKVSQAISEEDEKKIASIIEFAKSMSETTYQSIYLVDYRTRGFIYVSNNTLFLCGYTPQQVLKYGYLFYLKTVKEEDLEMLIKINEAGFYFFNNLSKTDKLSYSISYDFHLKQPDGSLMLINHKLKPVLLDKDQNPWIALCLVSLSSKSKAGNVRFKSTELKKSFELDLATKKWNEVKLVKLNGREKEILLYSAQGLTMNEIAALLFLSPDTIKFHRKNLLTKLGAKNISEAIAASIDLAVL